MQDAKTSTPADPAINLPIDGEHAVADTVADVSVDPAPDIADLLRKAETEASELKDAWLRARAETDNVRKQAVNDVAKAHKYAIERFAEDLLPVRYAIEHLVSGVKLTLRQLSAAFDKAGLTEIDPAGQKFDPHRHQAMQMVDSSQPANTVVNVFQKGYLINDRVLRPALVTVSTGTHGNA